jgi:hypothetical protein
MLAIIRANPYIRPIMSYWRNISPTSAVKDFRQVWSENPYRWRVLAISVAATTGLMMMIIPKSERIAPEKPTVTYITSFAPGRSDEEIIASNLENKKKQEAFRADQERRTEFRKQMYRELGRASGLDVDAMERQIAEDEAAEKRATEAEAKTAREKAAMANTGEADSVGSQ